MNRKIVGIILVCIIIIVFCFSIYYFINSASESMIISNYDKAISIGSKLLKEKFPDIISEESHFIGYKLDGIWHVQNIIINDSGVNTKDGKIFEYIENIRFIKFRDKSNEVITFGGDYSKNTNINYHNINNYDTVKVILNQILVNMFDLNVNLNLKYNMSIANDNWCISALIDIPTDENIVVCDGPYYEINIRNEDGMILYFGY